MNSAFALKALLNRGVLLSLAMVVTACSFFPETIPRYKRDGAPGKTLAACSIENAIPRVEVVGARGNPEKYTVKGKTYRVLRDVKGYRERGEASWYGTAFHGNPTSSGERYDMYQMTAAHKHLPLPSYVEVKNLDNQRRVIVRVNDRGPFISGRIIDLSYAAATKLGILAKGTARVEIAVLDPENFDYARWAGDHACQANRPPTTSNSYPVVSSQAASASNGSAGVQTSQSADAKPAITAVAEPATNHAASAAGSIYIQLATYSQLSTAEPEQQRLSKALLANDIHYAVGLYPYFRAGQERPWYRLRLGPIASQAKATQLMQHPLLARFGKIYTVSDD